MSRFYQLILILGLLTYSSLIHAKKSADYFLKFQPIINHAEQLLDAYARNILPELGVSRSEAILEQSIRELDSLRLRCEDLGPFKRNHQFNDSIQSILELTSEGLKKNSTHLLLLESYAHKTIEEMEAYIRAKEILANRLAQNVQQLIQLQAAFSKQYELNIDLSDANLRLKNTEDYISAYTYYHSFYLLFFDGNVKENYIIISIVTRNNKLLESHNRLLITATKKSLNALSTLGDHKGDLSLKKACEQIVRFYLYEANEEFPSMIAHLELAKEFTDYEAQYLSQNNASRAEEEIDSYQRMKTTFEKSKANYELTIERTNLFRTDRLTVWQDAVDDFFLNHLPR